MIHSLSLYLAIFWSVVFVGAFLYDVSHGLGTFALNVGMAAAAGIVFSAFAFIVTSHI